MELISRSEAKAAGLTRYYTGQPCKHGHVCERSVSRFQCVECMGEIKRKYYEANPEKVRERDRKYREANPEKVREKNRKYIEQTKSNESALDTLALLANAGKLANLQLTKTKGTNNE